MNLTQILAQIPDSVWSAIATAVLLAITTWLHANGSRIPGLAQVLDKILRLPAPAPSPDSPTQPTFGPLLEGATPLKLEPSPVETATQNLLHQLLVEELARRQAVAAPPAKAPA